MNFYGTKYKNFSCAFVLQHQKPDSVRRLLGAELSAIKSKTLTKKPTTRTNKALKLFLGLFEFLQIDEGSDPSSRTIYFEFEMIPLTELHVCFLLQIVFTVIYRARLLVLSGDFGLNSAYGSFKVTLLTRIIKWADYPIKGCISCQSI